MKGELPLSAYADRRVSEGIFSEDTGIGRSEFPAMRRLSSPRKRKKKQGLKIQRYLKAGLIQLPPAFTNNAICYMFS